MKALIKAARGEGLELTEIAVPEPGPSDVLIKVHKSAICGTDIHIWNWDEWAASTIPVPMVVGHEYIGEVAAIGEAVAHVAVGDRVTSEGHIVCGECRNCRAGREHLCRNAQGIGVNRPGAFAEYLCVPEHNVYPVPDSVPESVGAILDPYGNAVHTALSFDLVGEDILITGAGPIGVMAAAICRHAGARHVVITDVNDYRLRIARNIGVTRAVNIERQDLATVMEELGMVEGFDVGLEMSGAPVALNGMVASMNHGGKIALLGIPPTDTLFDWNDVIFKGLVVKGIYGREIFESWYKGLAMIQSGLDITPVLTHEFPIADYEEAFRVMKSGNSGKVVMDWGQEVSR